MRPCGWTSRRMRNARRNTSRSIARAVCHRSPLTSGSSPKPGDLGLHRSELHQARLAPLEDWFAFAQVQAFNSYLCSTVAHAHRMRGYRWVDDPTAIEAMKKKVPTSVGECFDLIERTIFKDPGSWRRATQSATPIFSRSRSGSKRMGRSCAVSKSA